MFAVTLAFAMTFTVLEEAQKNIELLGHDRYMVRERATRELQKNLKTEDSPVLSLIEKTYEETDDLEVRSRCRRLMNKYWYDFYDVTDDRGIVPDIWDVSAVFVGDHSSDAEVKTALAVTKSIEWMLEHLVKHKKISKEKLQNAQHSPSFALRNYYYKIAVLKQGQSSGASNLATHLLVKDLRDTGVSKKRIKDHFKKCRLYQSEP